MFIIEDKDADLEASLSDEDSLATQADLRKANKNKVKQKVSADQSKDEEYENHN